MDTRYLTQKLAETEAKNDRIGSYYIAGVCAGLGNAATSNPPGSPATVAHSDPPARPTVAAVGVATDFAFLVGLTAAIAGALWALG